MYENSYTVFREYIQNAADSIDKAIKNNIIEKDEAIIDISINPGKRKISIYDNACGIPKNIFHKKLSDIADSEKTRGEDKGFRGIGRLAGLAYCDKLIFVSSAYNESCKSIMEWDGAKLRDILNDNTLHPSASELVDSLITCHEEPCDSEDHFFEVIMENVTPESDDLLDEHAVIKYLSSVAPVDYSNTFIFRSKIYDFVKKKGLKLDEYNIVLNGNDIHKPYITVLHEGIDGAKIKYDEIKDIEFREFYSKNGELLGWLWFAITNFEKQIPIINEMRGIRLRKENIQIGNAETLDYPLFYKEPRGKYYFVGELFAVAPDLIPNARRDYFNKNSTLKEFEEKLYPTFYTEFYNLYHFANKVKSSVKAIIEYKKKNDEYEDKVKNSGFIDNEEQKAAEAELENVKKKADKAQRNLELRKQDANENTVFSRVYKQIEETYSSSLSDDNFGKSQQSEKKNKKYLAQSLSQYSKKEQKLITKIYNIINSILPKDMAESVVKKIQEELSK